MRLISCYIENFGGLSGYEVNFDRKLTVIMEENGFGKTTLAAFIKAMFFGFTKGARTLDKNERKLYNPWLGGRFGGNLVFEHEGKTYRIERFFGTTPKQDTFTLFQLQPFRESKDFSDKIGYELFQLDAESYEKSTYMAQKGGSSIFNTAGIETKLGDLAEEADDIYNYDKAVAALKDKRSKYKAYRGNGGSIYELNNKISNLQLKIANKAFIAQDYENLTQHQNELIIKQEQVDKELEEVRKRITEASEVVVLRNLSKQLSDLEEERNTINIQLENILVNYPKGLPIKENTDRAIECLEKLEKIDSRLSAIAVSDKDKKIYEDGKERFKEGIPSDESLKLMQSKSTLYISERAKLTAIEMTKDEPKKKTVNAILLILGMIMLCIGIGLVVGKLVMFGIGALILGIVLTIASLFTGKNNEPVTEFAQKKENLKSEVNALYEELEGFLESFCCGESVENASNILSELRNDCNLYRAAKIKIDEYQKESTSLEKEKQELETVLEDCKEAMALSELPNLDRLREINSDILKGEDLLLALDKNERKTEAFLAEYGKSLEEFNDEADIDINGLKLKEVEIVGEGNRINSEILKTKQELKNKTKELDEFPQLEDELEDLNQLFNEHIKACEILDQTIDFLEKAKNNLLYSYVNPVKERFEFYANQVLGDKKINFFMNKDLEVMPESYGEARELTYFSSGYTDIVRVCMHFALVDVLFKETDCFVILDDPFVNLDDEKTREAVEMMKKLSEKRQIIYLVCNSSRI